MGNIAGDSPTFRNLVLSHGALDELFPLFVNHVREQLPVTLLRNATWTLSNFCRGKPCPEWKYVQLAIKALTVMLTSEDEEVLQDSLWACASLSDTDDMQQIQSIKASGLLDRLITLLNHKSAHVRYPAVRTIGNIVTHDENQSQYVMNVMESLMNMIESDKTVIRREAMWAIANSLKEGSETQVLRLMEFNLMTPLIRWLKNAQHSKDEDYKKTCNNSIELIMSVEQPIKLLLSGYSRFHCEFGKDIPVDMLRIIMQFVAGSTLDLRKQIGRYCSV